MIRGPGELLGTKQTGVAQFKIADLLRDQSLVPYSLQLAQQLIAEQPQLISALTSRWLGESEQYAHA